MAASFAKRQGQHGERIARWYLEQRGFRCVAQNVHTRFGELDLVMLDRLALVFVEVKVRQGRRFGLPEEAMTQRKQQRIQTSGLVYLARHHWRGPYRFDVLTLWLHGSQWNVRHYRAAF